MNGFDLLGGMMLAPYNLTQPVLPNFMAPQFQFNFAGDPAIERRVVSEHASYGRQLGWLLEAVLELANRSELDSDAVARLRDLDEKIAELKPATGTADLSRRAERVLDRLQREDAAALQRLLQRYQPD